MKNEKQLLRDSSKRYNAIMSHVHYFRGLPDHTGKTIRDNKKYQEELSQLFLELSAKLDTLKLEEKQELEAIKQARKISELEVEHVSMARALAQHPRAYHWRQMSLRDHFRGSQNYCANLGKFKEREGALNARLSKERGALVQDFEVRCARLMRQYAGISDLVEEGHPGDGEKRDVQDEKCELVEDGDQEGESRAVDG